jgi:hypothetical protein
MEPMSTAMKARTVVVDYQRARHADAGRRRKANSEDANGAGTIEALVALLVMGLVVAAVYLADEEFWFSRVTPANGAEVGVVMDMGRRSAALPQETVRVGSESHPGIRR